jgi:hypothetical protein
MERPPSHRERSAAAVLPLLGLFLLLPPFITLFGGVQRPFGVPLIVIYVFGVWAVLVAAAAWLAQRLDRAPAPGCAAEASEPEPPA